MTFFFYPALTLFQFGARKLVLGVKSLIHTSFNYDQCSKYFLSKRWELGAVIFSFSGQEYPEVPCTIVHPLFDIIVYDIIVYEYGHNCLWHNCLLCRRLECKYINRRQCRILYEIINNFQLFWTESGQTNVPKVLSQESKKSFF